MLPPVCLFAYRRPIHLSRSWKSLADNAEAARTELHVFLDGAKTHDEFQEVAKTRSEAKKIRGFRKIFLHESEKNLGLSRSIINGIAQVAKKAPSWIVLEDDLVVGKNFLNFMHDALSCYEKNSTVASIHGYVYPTGKKLPKTFFLQGADCWGWGTWKRAWEKFNQDGGCLLKALLCSSDLNRFTFNGSADYLEMLKNQCEGKNDSWAIRWYASAFLAGMFTLYPGKSLVKNIGLDDSGTHCARETKYDTEPYTGKIQVEEIPIIDNAAARGAFEAFFRGNQQVRPKNTFRRFWPFKLRSYGMV